jgi:hypothetical protein
MKLSIQGNHFIDEQGRTVHLRGVNLGGSSKVPARPDGATWRPESLADHRTVSFVGRPFPLAEADEHFGRLRHWGLTCLRLLVTWEAIEHAGPGQYDEAYLDYLYAVVKRAADFDMVIYVDPHQDAWSRFSGGDGAPGWTFEVAGMDPAKFHETGAAVTHQALNQDYPRMIWTSNYGKFACATMWTLFFGGDAFAPQTQVEGVPIQSYLQDHYLAAVSQVAERLQTFDHVIGYDTLNEPSQGYIGYPDANQIVSGLVSQGPSPTIYQGMLLAAGYPQEVQDRGSRLFGLGWKGRAVLNAAGASLWREGYEPIWRQNGVWDVAQDGNPYLVRPDYFAAIDGRPVDFGRDFFAPFVRRYRKTVQAIDPGAMIFVTPPPPEMAHGQIEYGPLPGEGWVHAPHWYDGLTLGFQRYVSWLGLNVQGDRPRFTLGRDRKRRDFARQIGHLAAEAGAIFDNAPVVIGETGIAFNLAGGAAYRDGDFSKQVAAMDDTIQALEANLADFTLWNYTADNSNEHGDQWNTEDLSIFSRDQQTAGVRGDGLDAGGRALAAVVRPYASRIPGRPLAMSFDVNSRTFDFSFELDPAIDAPLVLFVPERHYPEGVVFAAPDGRIGHDRQTQLAQYQPNKAVMIHYLQIRPAHSKKQE